MSFTLEERRRLMRAYAPVLFLHRRESFVPVSPTAYMERAALWDDHSPGLHLRDNWGHPVEDAVFPRAPLLWPGQLTVNPAAAGGDVHFWVNKPTGILHLLNRMPSARCFWISAAGGRRVPFPNFLATLAGCRRRRRTAGPSSARPASPPQGRRQSLAHRADQGGL